MVDNELINKSFRSGLGEVQRVIYKMLSLFVWVNLLKIQQAKIKE